jgi:ankyrin repeat protein
VVEVLLAGGADVNAVNKIGQTPLIYACIEQKLDVAKLLLKVIYEANAFSQASEFLLVIMGHKLISNELCEFAHWLKTPSVHFS